MENVTKALLIAASVLIVVLLIAFGMRIFKVGSEPVEEVQGIITTTEIATFNSKFTIYVGTRNASNTRALINAVIANNASNTEHKVKINGNDPDINMSLNATVTISVEDSNNDGYIDNIKIN